MEGLIITLAIGALAGYLAGNLVKGFGYGLIGNIVIGMLGAIVGNWLFGMLGISVGGEWVGTLITSTAGAAALLYVVKLLNK